MEVFDPDREYSVLERSLPHWSQAGTTTFITWRTCDSMPTKIVREWQEERSAWLLRHGIDPSRPTWQDEVRSLDVTLSRELKRSLAARWNDHLDECHGACILRRPELAQIVTSSLQHFDGDRYELNDFVVMPNHVHILATFRSEKAMLLQCESWKRFTATRLNQALQRSGRFWQSDSFDHLVRSFEQLERLRRYIVENPKKANLKAGEYTLYSSRRA